LETVKGCKDYLGLWIAWQRSHEEVEAANAHIASCATCRQQLPGLIAGPLLEHSPHEMARALARFSQMTREQGFEQAVHDNPLAASYLAADPGALTRYRLSQKLLATGVGRDALPAEVQQVLHRHRAPAGRLQWLRLLRRLATAPVQWLTSLTSTLGRGWHAGWSALERAWRRFQAQNIGYRTIMAGMAIAAILVGSVVLPPRRVSEAGARSAIYAALPKVVEARTHLKKAPTRQEVKIVAQQVEVRLIHVNGVTLPWPTLSPETANVTAIGAGLRQFPSLRRVYHDYLAQWIELFPHVDDSLSDSNLSGAIQVFEYLRHVSPYDRDKSLRFSLGELYKLRGKDDDNSHRQAIAVYDDMIASGMAEGDPRPWHYAGWSFFKLHEYDRALEYYEKALSLLPPNAPTRAKILYNIARAYEAKGGLSTEDHRRLVDNNIQRALDITLAADQCEGRVNARVPFTLAILYAVKQEPATALHYLERAIQQRPIYAVRAKGENAFEETFLNPAHPLSRYHQEFLNLLEQYWPQAQGSRTEGGEEPFNPCIFWE